MPIKLKRIYERPEESDGRRILVDRIWPRGLSKQDAALDLWLREIAPSDELRKWYGHDPERWEVFRARYFEELNDRTDVVDQLSEIASDDVVTLVFGARDEEHNNAVALKEYLEKRRDA